MIETSDHISKFILIVPAYREVLSPHVHVINKGQLALIIKDVRFLARNRHVPLLATYQEEPIIWYVECLEVPWEIMLSKLIFINEL